MAKKKSTSYSITQLSSLIDNIGEESKIIIENEDHNGTIDTSVYILNALLSKSIFGGVADDRITIFAGDPNTGKSYIMYNITRNAQKVGYYVIFIDTEHSINKSILSDFGVKTDKDSLKLITSNKIEDLKIFLTKFLDELKTQKANDIEIPKIIILLDSIGQLASEKEKEDALAGKSKVDMTRAKSIKQFFRIINSDMGYLSIPMIASNHVYEDTTSFFPTKIMSGGKGVEYSASTVIFLSTAKLKTGREDELDLNATGSIITAQAKKNRMAKPKKIKFEIDHSYGTNRYKGLEYFCTFENFDKVGIAIGKKSITENGEVSIVSGGKKWYVKHLDKSFFEKQLYSPKIFTQEVLEALDPIIYKYFDYSSFEEEQSYISDIDNDIDVDSDFDNIDNNDLF